MDEVQDLCGYCEICGNHHRELIQMGKNRKVEYGEWGHLSKRVYEEYLVCVSCFKKILKETIEYNN